jgi:hypothetical protein
MSAGYGRGHYGDAQLSPRRSGGSGWFKIAVVAGLGVVIWKWVLPRIGPKSTHVLPSSPPPSPSVPSTTHDEDLEKLAQLRGFSSKQAFEDSVVGTARELRASGAKVDLGPHLQYLEPRL